MTTIVRKMQHVALLAGVAFAMTACGEQGMGAVASDGSVASDPHASLAAAADIMKAQPASGTTEAAPAAEQQ